MDALSYSAEVRLNQVGRHMDMLNTQTGMQELQSQRLIERQEKFTEAEGELERHRRDARRISATQTMFSSFAAAVGVGAAMATGVGEAAAVAMVAAAALQMGHNLASNFGFYDSFSEKMGGSHREIEERAADIRKGVGWLSMAASVATLAGGGAATWSSGYKWATDGRALSLMQGGMTILSNRCNTNQLHYQVKSSELQQEMGFTRMDSQTVQESMRLTMSEVESLFKQALHAWKIQDQLNETIARGA